MLGHLYQAAHRPSSVLALSLTKGAYYPPLWCCRRYATAAGPPPVNNTNSQQPRGGSNNNFNRGPQGQQQQRGAPNQQQPQSQSQPQKSFSNNPSFKQSPPPQSQSQSQSSSPKQQPNPKQPSPNNNNNFTKGQSTQQSKPPTTSTSSQPNKNSTTNNTNNTSTNTTKDSKDSKNAKSGNNGKNGKNGKMNGKGGKGGKKKIPAKTAHTPPTPHSNPKLAFLGPNVFKQHELEQNEQNLPLLKALEMMREAEEILDKENGFDRAEAILIGAIDYMTRQKVTDTWAMGRAHANLGYVLQQRFKYDAAMDNYDIGLSHLTKGPIKNARFLGLRQLGFAELLSLQGKNQQAAVNCEQAITHLQSAVGANDALVGMASNNLASYMLLEGNTKKAAPVAERALGILKLSLGKHNKITQNCAVNLAKIYTELGQQQEIEKLDSQFLSEDKPILSPEPGKFDKQYINDLKKKWRNQGPRKIFDPPGLHRSAALSAQSYSAFLSAWKTKSQLRLHPAGQKILESELRSLQYSFDQLPPFIPKPMPLDATDKAKKYRTGFEHLKLRGVTSIAEALDRDAITPDPTAQDMFITPDEWRAAAKREAEYKAIHGDPLVEAAEAEFKRSLTDIHGPMDDEAEVEAAAKEAEEDEGDEEEDGAVRQEDEEADEELEEAEQEGQEAEEGEEGDEDYDKDQELIEKRWGGEAPTKEELDPEWFMEDDHKAKDWDGDTYNAWKAMHGTPEEQFEERSKNLFNPKGVKIQRPTNKIDNSDVPVDLRPMYMYEDPEHARRFRREVERGIEAAAPPGYELKIHEQVYQQEDSTVCDEIPVDLEDDVEEDTTGEVIEDRPRDEEDDLEGAETPELMEAFEYEIASKALDEAQGDRPSIAVEEDYEEGPSEKKKKRTVSRVAGEESEEEGQEEEGKYEEEEDEDEGEILLEDDANYPDKPREFERDLGLLAQKMSELGESEEKIQAAVKRMRREKELKDIAVHNPDPRRPRYIEVTRTNAEIKRRLEEGEDIDDYIDRMMVNVVETELLLQNKPITKINKRTKQEYDIQNEALEDENEDAATKEARKAVHQNSVIAETQTKLKERFAKRKENFRTGPSGPNPDPSILYPHDKADATHDRFPAPRDDRDHDRTPAQRASETAETMRREIEKRNPPYRHGRLHEMPTHTDEEEEQ